MVTSRRATVCRRPRRPHTPARSKLAFWAPIPAGSCSVCAICHAVPVFSPTPARSRCSRWPSRGRHRHRPHGAGLRRGRQGDHRQRGRCRSPRWTRPSAWCWTIGASRSSRPTRRSSGILKNQDRRGRDLNRPVLIRHETYDHQRTAGVAQSADPGRCRPGSSRSPSSGTGWMNWPAEITWYPEHVKDDPVRQVAARTPGTS